MRNDPPKACVEDCNYNSGKSLLSTFLLSVLIRHPTPGPDSGKFPTLKAHSVPGARVFAKHRAGPQSQKNTLGPKKHGGRPQTQCDTAIRLNRDYDYRYYLNVTGGFY